MKASRRSNPASSTLLRIRVVPRSAAYEICGNQSGRLTLRVPATPVDGDAIRRLVAEYLEIPVCNLEIVAGRRRRDTTTIRVLR